MNSYISWALFFIMFSLGTSLRIKDFQRVTQQKEAVGLGLLLQMVLLPLLALIIAWIAPLRAEWKLGLFIVSLCPGGATSNFISYLVNADTALSVSLTCVNSFLILISVPLMVNLSVEVFLGQNDSYNISLLDTALDMFYVILLPVTLGVLFRHFLPHWVFSLKEILKISSTIILASVFAFKIFWEQNDALISWSDIIELLPYCFLLHFLAITLSYAMSKWILSDKKQSVTIGIEVGLQNTALALLITDEMMDNALIGYPALVFAMFTFFTTFGFAWWKKGFT